MSSAHRGSPHLHLLLDAIKSCVEAHPLSLSICALANPATEPSGSGKQKVEGPGNGGKRMMEAGKLCQQQGNCRSGDPSGYPTAVGKKKPLVDTRIPHCDTCTDSPSFRRGKAKPSMQEREEGGGKKQRMRPATEVISRIQWDPDLTVGDFSVGYLDRFTGIIEKPFQEFFWEDISSVGDTVLAVPKHRIQYFKYRGEIVWDKRVQLDNFFGSRGTRTIKDIVSQAALQSQHPSGEPSSEGHSCSSEVK